MAEIDYGKLLEQNSYTQRWSDVSQDARRYLVDAYVAGGSSGLALALGQLSLSIPLNTARGHMVRAGIKVKGQDYERQLEQNRSPRIYPVDVEKEAVRVAFIGDEQVPFNDKTITARVQKLVADFKPDVFVLLGDMLDCYSVSRFIRDPRRRLSFASEVDSGRDYLSSWAGVSDAASLRIFLKGNHERRIEDYLVREAPALADLPQLQLDSLLGLSERGYQVFEYGQSVDFRGFIATHGWYTGPNAAASMGTSLGRSGISGHNHQAGAYSWTDGNGPKTWWVNGTLMEINAVNPDYVVGIANWSQGITLGQWVGTDFTIMPVILRGKQLVAPWGETY